VMAGKREIMNGNYPLDGTRQEGLVTLDDSTRIEVRARVAPRGHNADVWFSIPIDGDVAFIYLGTSGSLISPSVFSSEVAILSKIKSDSIVYDRGNDARKSIGRVDMDELPADKILKLKESLVKVLDKFMDIVKKEKTKEFEQLRNNDKIKSSGLQIIPRETNSNDLYRIFRQTQKENMRLAVTPQAKAKLDEYRGKAAKMPALG